MDDQLFSETAHDPERESSQLDVWHIEMPCRSGILLNAFASRVMYMPSRRLKPKGLFLTQRDLCLSSSNEKLVVTGATLVVTGALLVVTRSSDCSSEKTHLSGCIVFERGRPGP